MKMKVSLLLLHKVALCALMCSRVSISEVAGTSAPLMSEQGSSEGPEEAQHLGHLGANKVRRLEGYRKAASELKLENLAQDVTTDKVPPESNKCWIFMHLQKCGGSTVKEILEDIWGSRFFIYDSGRWKMGEEFLASFGNQLARGDTWNVMAGGYTEALRRSATVDSNCQFFTLFRHPVERMVSAYFYCKVVENDWACATEALRARDVDLLTFAKHWGNFALRQFALSFVPADNVEEYIRTPKAQALHDFDLEKIAGWYQLKMYLERPLEAGEAGAAPGQMEVQQATTIPDAQLYPMLEPAQDLIRDGYAAVGILEHWNTTLELFEHALDMPVVDWRVEYEQQGRKNVNTWNEPEVQREVLERALTDPELKKYMQLDLLLYEHAVDVFNKQARSYGLL